MQGRGGYHLTGKNVTDELLDPCSYINELYAVFLTQPGNCRNGLLTDVRDNPEGILNLYFRMKETREKQSWVAIYSGAINPGIKILLATEGPPYGSDLP